MVTKRILNKRSSVVENGQPKIPTADMMEYGEIALNFAADKETLSIKNSNDSIVSVPINRQKLKEMVFADMWTALSGYTYENDVFKDDTDKTYTYENAVKKYHALITFANGYNYVDLGLPSGLLWADRNVGAASPESTGLYFQWGDVKHNKIGFADGGDTLEGKKNFSYADYKWTADNGATFTKYNDTDKKTVLDMLDDAAYVNMGGNWRMPTEEDVVELFENTNVELLCTDGSTYSKDHTGENGFDVYWNTTPAATIRYVKFINKVHPENYIILPADGYAKDYNIMDEGVTNYYWISNTSTPVISFKKDVDMMAIEAIGSHEGDLQRCYGCNVRGVVMPNNYK